MRALCGLLLFSLACVGDAPVTPNDGGGKDVATTNDAGTDSPTSNDSGGDVQVTCTTPEIDCGGTCVDTANSAKNCGTCGHDCGGGQCVDGVCQPFAIRDNLSSPVHMGVNDTGVFFAEENDPLFEIEMCPLTGCTQAPKVIGAAINYIYDLAAGPGTVLFFSSNQTTKDRPTLFYCADAGCPSSVLTQQVDSDGLGSLSQLTYEGTHAYWDHQNAHALRHAECNAGTCSSAESIYVFTSNSARLITSDATSVYWIDSAASALSKCPASGTCTTPTGLTTLTATVVALTQANNLLYFLNSGASGYQNGTLRSCSTTTCTPTNVVQNLAYPQLLAQDGTTGFWYAGDTGVLQSAALQNPGPPAALVKNLGSVGFSQLKTHGNYIYWVQNSPSVDAGGKLAIMALAK